jgi:Flp pilus assembly protein TadD
MYASFLSEQNNHEEALAHGRVALRINPADARAHNLIGSILIRQGNTEQARHHISEALRLKPDYEAARENLQQLQAYSSKS